MIGITLDVNHLRRDILCLVADGVNKDAATHRTIRTGRSRLSCASNLKFFQLRDCGLEIETEKREARAPHERASEEVSARKFHCASSDYFAPLSAEPDCTPNFLRTIDRPRIPSQFRRCRIPCEIK